MRTLFFVVWPLQTLYWNPWALLWRSGKKQISCQLYPVVSFLAKGCVDRLLKQTEEAKRNQRSNNKSHQANIIRCCFWVREYHSFGFRNMSDSQSGRLVFSFKASVFLLPAAAVPDGERQPSKTGSDFRKGWRHQKQDLYFNVIKGKHWLLSGTHQEDIVVPLIW